MIAKAISSQARIWVRSVIYFFENIGVLKTLINPSKIVLCKHAAGITCQTHLHNRPNRFLACINPVDKALAHVHETKPGAYHLAWLHQGFFFNFSAAAC